MLAVCSAAKGDGDAALSDGRPFADQLADILTAAAGDGRPSRSAAGSRTRRGWPLAFWSRNAALGGWRLDRQRRPVVGDGAAILGPPDSPVPRRLVPSLTRVAICRRWRAHPSLDDRLGPAGRTGPQLLGHRSDPPKSDNVVPGPSISRCNVVSNAIRLHCSDASCSTFSPIARRSTNCKQVRHFWQLSGRPTSVIASKIRRAAAAISGAPRWRTRSVAASFIRVGRVSRRTHLHIPRQGPVSVR
jgi:hypothetical protein